MRKPYILLLSLIFCSTLLQAQNLFWVGGSGAWNDPAHWAATSGGNGGSIIPNENFDVIIDLNSISEGDIITIDESAAMHSLTIDTKKVFSLNANTSGLIKITENWNIHSESQLNLNLANSVFFLVNKPDFLRVASITGGFFFADGEMQVWEKKKWKKANGGVKAGHTASVTVTNPLCNGYLTGSAVGSASGGIGPYTYFWTGGTIGTGLVPGNPISNLGAGTYTLYVFDSDGTLASTVFFIVDPPVINGFFIRTPPSCIGSSDGAINIAFINGGTGSTYNVEWSTGLIETGVTSSSITGLVEGPYWVEITDSVGCIVTRYDTLVDPTGVFINASVNDVTCFGFNDGSITTNATSGNPGPFTYLWGPDGEITPDISNKLAGSYTLHIEDAKGCPKDTTIIIDEPSALTAAITSKTNLLCNGDCSVGEAIVTPGGGIEPYTYQWFDSGNNPIPGYTDSTASNLCAGTYSVSILDANGCSITLNNIVISEPAPLSAVSSSSPALCNGTATGSVVVTPAGGTIPYSFTWTSNPGGLIVGTDSLVNALPAGTYDYEVLDANNCVIGGSEIIGEPDTISFDFTKLDLLCFGDVNGQAVVSNVAGGDGVYSYAWRNAASTIIGINPSINNLIAGSYSITVTDGNNCSKSLAFDIIEPTALSLSLSMDSVSCNGLSDGAVHVIASGGTVAVDYNYDWRNALNVQVGTSADVTGLPVGTYTVTVTDDNNCTDVGSISILEPLPLSVTPSITPVTCNGAFTGAISVVISGGTPSYQTNWTGPNAFVSTNQNISALEAGSYTLTVTDANGCTDVQNYDVLQPDPITFIPTIVDVLCFSNATGSISVVVSGGNGGYLYDWRNAANVQLSTTNTISNVVAGDYTLTVTDSKNCVYAETFTINELSDITFNANVSIISCFNANDGAIDLLPNGGTAPYLFSWTSPNGFSSSNQNISGLAAGSYTCTITDLNSCSKDTTIILLNPTPITVTETLTHVICNGDSTGAIDIVISGGTPVYLFDWTGPNGFISTDQNISNLIAGDYDLTLTDAGGCTVNESYTINETIAITVIPTITDVLCKGDSTGAIQVVASGGNGNFSYEWRDASNTLISISDEISDVPAGDYTLTITDDLNCSVVNIFTIQEPLQGINLSLSAIDVACFGASTGSVAVAISGGTVVTPADYTIEWYNASNTLIGNTQIINNLAAGTYTVFVSDLNNCVQSDSIEVTEASDIVINPSVTDVLCNGDASGSASVSPIGGTVLVDYSYEWEEALNPGVIISTTNSISNVVAGDYIITVFDDNMCSQTTTVTISEPTAIVLALDITEPLCNGDANGQIEVMASGGVVLLDYTYEWLNDLGNPIGTNALISGLSAGNYSIIVTDDNGCVMQMPVLLGEPALITFTSTVQQISCAGVDDGEISVIINGGSLPYSANWTDAFGNDLGSNTTLSNLGEGDYTLTVVDVNNCSYSESYTITPQSEIVGSFNQYALGDCSLNPPCIAAAVVTASGGTGIYNSYQWTDVLGNDLGINNDTATGLCAGSYMVSITDSDGCTGDVLVLINDQDPEDITVQSTDAVCNGDLGTAIAQYVCVDAPCSIEWFNATNNTNTGLTGDTVQLAAGDYFVAITNATGCTTQVLFSIDEPSMIIPNASSTMASCAGLCDGSASVAPTGGTGPYTYVWDDPMAQSTATATDLCPGDYMVIITDANLCDSIVTISVGAPAALTVVPNITQVSCQGEANGIIELAVSGGSGVYSYNWTPAPPIGNGTAIGSGLDAGDYTIEIEDVVNPGCLLTLTYTITQPDSLQALISSVESTCTSDDGEASVVVSGGSPGYTYLWNDPAGQTTATASGLFAGIYVVTVSDTNLCTEDFVVAVNDQTADTVEVSMTTVQCFGDSSTVSAIYNCSSTPCVISWYDNLGNQLPISGDVVILPVGNYFVSIINGLGCKRYLPFEIIGVNAILPNLTINNPSCNGPADGSASVSPVGGSGNYNYMWVPEPGSGQGTASVDGLYPGTWELTITDDSGCDTLVTFEILPYSPIIASESHTDLSCNGDNSATANIIASGGNAPLTYTWSPVPASGQGSANVGGLYAGDWSVTIADASGCDTTLTITILEPSLMSADSVVVNASCNLVPGDGSIDLIISGGTPPYNYQWFDAAGNDLGVSTSTISGLEEGIYHCDVVDDSLCTRTFVAIVSEQSGEDITTGNMPVNCYNGDDGMAWVEYVCGDAPCTVNWYDELGVDLGLTTDTIYNLIAGSYIVGVTNASGCVSYQNVIVSEAPQIVIDIAVVDATCSGICDGEATASVSGGVGNLSYLWVPEPAAGQGTANVTGLCGGAWTLYVTDENGCMDSVQFDISEIEVIVSNLQITNESCEGDCNGSASVNPIGGSGVYTYFWSPEPGSGQGTNAVSGLCGGDYSVEIVDVNTGCNLSEMFSISQINPIYMVDSTLVYPECENDNSGSIEVVFEGGVLPYSYQWYFGDLSPIAGEVDSVITGLTPGSYIVEVTDDQGCTHTESFVLDAQSLLIADAGPDTSYCGGGTLTLVGTGNGATSFWSDIFGNILAVGDSLTIDAQVGNFGYIFQTSDGICTADDTVYVVVFAQPFANAGPDQDILKDESVQIGGDPTGPGGSSILWQPSESLSDSTVANPVSSPLETTTYIVYVEDANGCINSDTMTVNIVPKFNPNNGFTPNGDGINDVWTIGDLTDYPDIEVNIFNRWGQQLFTSKGYDVPWDGKFNGKEVPVGTYYYVIDLHDEKYPDPFTGPLTIMR